MMMMPAGLFKRGQPGEHTSRCWRWEPGSEPGVQDGDTRTETRGTAGTSTAHWYWSLVLALLLVLLTGTGTGTAHWYWHIALYKLCGDNTDGLADYYNNAKSCFSLSKRCQS